MLRLFTLAVAAGLMAFATSTASAQHFGGYRDFGYRGGGGGYFGGVGSWSNPGVSINNFGGHHGYRGIGYSRPIYGYGYNTYRPVYVAPVFPVYGGFGGYGGYPVFPVRPGCGNFGRGTSIFIGF